MGKQIRRNAFRAAALACLLAGAPADGSAPAETNPAAPTPAAEATEADAAWARHVVESYQQLQRQQQEMLRAIEQARQDATATARAIEAARLEAEAAARRNTEAIESRLSRIEQTVTAQRERELQTLQSSHRFTLVIVGVFAGVGFFGMLAFAVLLLRSMNRRVELALAHPAGPSLAAGFAPAALGPGEAGAIGADAAARPAARFLGTIERLEKRLQELEATAQAAGPATAAEPAAPVEPEAAPAGAGVDRAARIALLMGKGQALLNLQQPDTALACFEEVISIDPTNAEAFVKKGVALERLGRLDEAIDCYDRAIALDNSMTMAYLNKGGVFNRLERYGEALQCYEQALRAQQKTRVS